MILILQIVLHRPVRSNPKPISTIGLPEMDAPLILLLFGMILFVSCSHALLPKGIRR